MSNTTSIDPNLISTFVADLASWVVPSISPSSIAASPITQAGVDTVGKSIAWQPPPPVIMNQPVRMLLQDSQDVLQTVKDMVSNPAIKIPGSATLVGGTIGLKALLFEEFATAMATAPAASAGLIGLAFIVGVAIGTGIDYSIGAALNDGKINTLSEWLATKWAEPSSLPISQALPNEKGQWTTGWRYIPQNAPSGAPADPIRSPGEQGSPITAPAAPSVEEIEMKRKKEETIGDRPERHETLKVLSPKQLDLDPTYQKLVEEIRKDPNDQAAWAVFADYLSEHGEPQRGELILLDKMIAQTRGPVEKSALEVRKKELEKALDRDLSIKLDVPTYLVHFHWKRGYLEKVFILSDLVDDYFPSIEHNPKFFDALFQSEDARFLRTIRFNQISDGFLRKFLSYPQIARISDLGFINGYSGGGRFSAGRQISHEGVRALTESSYLKSLTNFQLPNDYGRSGPETRRMLSDWARKNNILLNGKIY